MKFLNLFKMKNQINHAEPTNQIKRAYSIHMSHTKDGRLQIDFQDNKTDMKHFYDTTRLIVNDKPIQIGQYTIYDCDISWYGSTDATMLDKNGEEFSRKTEYRSILAEIDIDKMQNDSNYCEFVMKSLLNQDRVQEYLERGLQDSPEIPCGRYVGGVKDNGDGTYNKYFSTGVGLISHSSPKMVHQRNEYKRMQEAKKDRQISERQAEIKRLQNEIDSLSR